MISRRALITIGMSLGLLAPALAFADTTTFVPLSNIPIAGLNSSGGSPNLTSFLQGVYTICIAIAVVLTVLQLVRAGITYMTAAGSIGSTEQAKHLISSSLLGLILVLSPYLVLSLINPCILSLSITGGGGGQCKGSLQDLQTNLAQPDTTQTTEQLLNQQGVPCGANNTGTYDANGKCQGDTNAPLGELKYNPTTGKYEVVNTAPATVTNTNLNNTTINNSSGGAGATSKSTSNGSQLKFDDTNSSNSLNGSGDAEINNSGAGSASAPSYTP